MDTKQMPFNCENEHPIESIQSQAWDVIVVGTGMGGSTAGFMLAKQGYRVLFLEKGAVISAGQELTDANNAPSRLRAGWWPNPVSKLCSDGSCEQFYAPVGCGVGGSTIHYAAALERMASSDFEELHAEKQTISAWPVSFQEFEPYYRIAENLYGVSGCFNNDQNRLSDWDKAFMSSMRSAGLHPTMLKVGIRYDGNCQECIGKVCLRQCKSDAKTTCIDQALKFPTCTLLEGCDVQSLNADGQRINMVQALYQGKPITLNSRIVILAAGALHSPQILLNSANEFWPNGLANQSDQVGRNLMFHTADIYAIWAPGRFSRRGIQKKSISIRDFYFHEGKRLGYIQSMGLDAGRGHIAMYLKDSLRRFGVRNGLLLSILVKIPSHIAAWMLGNAGVFAAMTEDDPDPHNRVILDVNEPNGSNFTYEITVDLRNRATDLFLSFKKAVHPWKVMKMSSKLEMNYGHPCGTCRFGDNSETSVLDKNCKAHGIDNLYIIDSSFMPRSGAINPSLTIAANAIRSATKIAEAFPLSNPATSC